MCCKNNFVAKRFGHLSATHCLCSNVWYSRCSLTHAATYYVLCCAACYTTAPRHTFTLHHSSHGFHTHSIYMYVRVKTVAEVCTYIMTDNYISHNVCTCVYSTYCLFYKHLCWSKLGVWV